MIRTAFNVNMLRDLRPVCWLCRAKSFSIAACVGVLLNACTNGAAKSPPIDTPRVAPTVTPGFTRTLPLTWTPTFTFTPLPPTATPTVTLTPPPTATYDPVRLCQDFDVFSIPSDGIEVGHDGRVAFSWRGAPPGMIVRVALLHRETEEGILVEWDSHQALNMTVDMALLPDTGVYDWTLTLYEFPLGDRCPVEGWFVRLTPEESITPTLELTPTQTPTISPTPTSETSPTATP